MKKQFKVTVDKIVVLHNGNPVYGFKVAENQKKEYSTGNLAIHKDHFMQAQFEYEGKS
jgi:hypothetical protein